MTQVKIYSELSHEFGLPQYETDGAACMDVRSNESIKIKPKETVLVSTGIYVAVPKGFVMAIVPRSGVSLKTSLRVANSPARIDSDYRGEVKIILQNTHSSCECFISKGERIAQLELQEVPKIEWVNVDSLEQLGSTERGAGGFGSTGTA